MPHVLVTGASGFIGSNVVGALRAHGQRIRCLLRTTSQTNLLDLADVETVYGDVTDVQSVRQAVSGVEVVYHVAGCNRALRPERLFEVNEEGVRNVARACAQEPNPPVLVYVSSLAACGPSREDRPRVETDPAKPVSSYGRSKRAGELAARDWAEDVPITIVRPPIVLGNGDRMGLGMFTAISRLGLHCTPRWGRERFSLIDAGDLAALLIAAAERGARITRQENDPGSQVPNGRGCYFAAYRENPSYAELGRLIAEALGRRVVRVPMLMTTIWTSAAAGELVGRLIRRPVYLNFDKAREIAAGDWTCSPQAAEEELGFDPDVPLDRRLAETVQWYREHGWL